MNSLFARAMESNAVALKTPLQSAISRFPIGAEIQVNGEEYYGPAKVTKVGVNLLGAPLVHIARYEGDRDDLAFYPHECEITEAASVPAA